MNLGDYPRLLLKGTLLAPIDRSLRKLQEAKDHCVPTTDEILLHGLFVMVMSYMEVMLTDVLKYYLKCFPEKIPGSEFKYDKNIFFTSYRELLNATVGACQQL